MALSFLLNGFGLWVYAAKYFLSSNILLDFTADGTRSMALVVLFIAFIAS
jgi:hypothetical protein